VRDDLSNRTGFVRRHLVDVPLGSTWDAALERLDRAILASARRINSHRTRIERQQEAGRKTDAAERLLETLLHAHTALLARRRQLIAGDADAATDNN